MIEDSDIDYCVVVYRGYMQGTYGIERLKGLLAYKRSSVDHDIVNVVAFYLELLQER